MRSVQPNTSRQNTPQEMLMEKVCKHPKVRVVAREEDAEYVECQECGDIFEASEYKDMAIEESIRATDS